LNIHLARITPIYGVIQFVQMEHKCFEVGNLRKNGVFISVFPFDILIKLNNLNSINFLNITEIPLVSEQAARAA
jgi:hypothetical protein